MKNWLAFVVIIAFSVLGVVGDYLLKLASDRKNPFDEQVVLPGFRGLRLDRIWLGLRDAALEAGDDWSGVLGVDDSAAHGRRRGCLPRAALGLRDRRSGHGDCLARSARSLCLRRLARATYGNRHAPEHPAAGR